MQRREFIKNSALLLGCCSILSGCKQEQDAIYKKVERRTLNGISFPLISLGGLMSYPVDGVDISLSDFKKAVDLAMKSNMNYFDTAYAYKYKETEEKLGEALKKYDRKSYIFANKLSVYSVKKKEDVRRIFNEQLKRCKVDYFDNYTIFNIVKKNIEKYRKNKIYDEVLKLKQEGKIRNIGFSGPGNPGVFREIVSEYKWDYCHLKLNYLDWKLRKQEELYKIAQEKGLAIFVTEALRGATLLKLSPDIEEKIKEFNKNETPASFALRWAASKKGVISVLSDCDDVKQIKENIETFSNFREFTLNEEKNASKILNMINSKGIVVCDNCGHCKQVCPQGIDIPLIFSIYNKYKLSSLKNRQEIFIKDYEKIDKLKTASNCMNCTSCLKCHQHLDIPNLLKEVHDTYLSAKSAKRA